MNYKKEYRRWLENCDWEISKELLNFTEKETEDSFYRDLSFGTGGLRGVIGPGTNRMNVLTVGRATKGLAEYLKKNFSSPAVVIGYDSRIKSFDFAKKAGEVFWENGIKVYFYNRILPVPTVSFAVRSLKCQAGIMITASHNPKKYNGYKVYGSDGCQITTEDAKKIMKEIEGTDIFYYKDQSSEMKNLYKKNKDLEPQPVPEWVFEDYLKNIKRESVLYGDPIDKTASIVYTPLNGTGLEPVLRILKETGFRKLNVVEEQKDPDGNFPTCPYPNPEVREALDLGIEYAKRNDSDLLIATDPDCDRVGIAVKDNNDYRLLSGNETGLLLLDFICSQRKKHGTMPERPLFIKTIVTTDLAERIAESYGVETVNVLTGFKFIGEQIGLLEKAGEEKKYIFGFEESYGYLSGSYVRDKDGVNGVFLICEMFGFYKKQGISLIERLNSLYEKYGYSLNTLHSFEFEGSEGASEMKAIMEKFRKENIPGLKIEGREDYLDGIKGLPKSDVLKFILKGGSSLVIRPSGTEPKIKIYLNLLADNKERALEKENDILKALEILKK